MKQHDFSKYDFSTAAIHAGQEKDPIYGAAVPPICQTTTFVFDTVAEPAAIYTHQKEGFTYTRGRNPTNHQLEQKLACLEKGEACVVTASGIAAISSTLFTLLQAGDHIVASDTLYGGTTILLHTLNKFGVQVTSVDMTDMEALEAAFQENTKVVYLETPANPTLKLIDLQACTEIAHRHGALAVCDSTFAPAPVQNVLTLGVDICIHSTTKYLNGHGDAVGGAVIGPRSLVEEIRVNGMKCVCGAAPSPFNSWLAMRGMKTFALRIVQHCESAMKVAKFLEAHPYIAKVNYPGLESHPQHELAKKQMNGLFGGMISFEMKEGIHGLSAYDACTRLLDHLEIISLGVSLGDADSLIEHPASMTHITNTREELEQAGISDRLIRLSVGLESPRDLIHDLEQSLNTL